MIISENEDVRFPTQLLSPKDDDEPMDIRIKDNGNNEQDKDVSEFCAVGGGAIAGVTGPIMGSFTGVPSTKSRRKKKKNRS